MTQEMTITSMLEAASASAGPAPSTSPGTGATGGASAPSGRPGRDEPMMLVPAGFVADMISGLSGTIGEVTGGIFGNRKLGRDIGEAASPLIKLLPFQVVPPVLAPQSAGPEGAGAEPGSEALVVVPAGFLGGVLGGLGGQLLGGVVGDWLGDKKTGETAGSAIGGVLGGLLPFQVVPPTVAPQSVGPDGTQAQEAMVVVPAGFFGDLLGGVAGAVGELAGGTTGRQFGEAASPFLRLLPFQAVPEDLVPQSAGPDGGAPQERLVVLPAGFFGNLLSGLAGTVGSAVGGAFGDARTGQAVGDAAAPLLKLLPFKQVPAELAPQSTDPAAPSDPLMAVPAGLFSSLLNCWSGTLVNSLPPSATDVRKLLPFQAAPTDRVLAGV